MTGAVNTPGPEDGPQNWWAAQWEGELVLPARCPVCLSMAARPAPVQKLTEAAFAPYEGDASGLTAHYCDLCADEIAAQGTRRLAALLATTLVVITVTTGLALLLGSVAVGGQIATAWGLGIAAVFLLRLVDRRFLPPLLLLSNKESQLLLARRRRYLEQLPHPRVSSIAGPRLPNHASHFLPLAAGLLWLGALHVWGTAKIVVVLDGVDAGVVTVDHRLRATTFGITEERPGVGTAISTLGGRRYLSLVRENGEILVEEEVLLWPTRTYILASPQVPGCFFVETQEYGQAGSAHTLQPLSPPGPVWELPVPIDRWFASTAPREDLETSGGIRRALRLLPCERPPLAASAP